MGEVGRPCSYCRYQFDASDLVRQCEACSSVLHADCWVDGNGCASFGCTNNTAAGIVAGAPSVSSAQTVSLPTETQASDASLPKINAGQRIQIDLEDSPKLPAVKSEKEPVSDRAVLTGFGILIGLLLIVAGVIYVLYS